MRRVAAGGAAAVLAVVATALGLSVAAAVLAVATPAGLHWALRAADHLTPGRLAADRVAGSVLRGVRLEGVRVEGPGLAVEVERLEIVPRWRALREGRFVIGRLAVDGGRVAVASREPEPGDGSPPRLPTLPEWLEVRSLSLAALTVDALGTPIAIERVDAAVAAGTVALESAALRSGSMSLALAASVDVANGAARDVEGVLTWTDPEAGAGAAPQQVVFAGRVTLATSTAPWRIDTSWSRLSWLGSPAGGWSSPGGRAVVTPGTTPIRVEAAASVVGDVLPDALDLEGTVEVDGAMVEVLTLEARSADAKLGARGALDLDTLTGFLAAELDGLEPARFDRRLQGRLGGRAYVAVAHDGELRVGAAGALRGELGGRELDGRLTARYSEQTLEIREGVVVLGDGRLEAAGTVSPESSALRLSAELPSLGDWHPAAAGSVRATASVRGATRDPTVALELEGRSLAWADAPGPPLEVTASIAGTLAQHALRVTAHAGAAGSATVVTRQGVRGQRVSGTLLESRLRTARAGEWTLAAPAEFTAGKRDFLIRPACYREAGGGELCVSVADRRLDASMQELPAALAQHWLPDDVVLAGNASGTVALDWHDELTGSLELMQPSLVVSTAGEEWRQIGEITGLQLAATLDPAALDASVSAEFAPTHGVLEGRLRVAPPSADGELDGELIARADDLTVLGALLPGIEDLRGALDARLEIGGSPAAPRVRGGLTADALAAALPRYGTEISDGRLRIASSGLDGFTFDGRLCSEGCLTLDGRLALPDKAPWRLDGHVEGSGFRLIETEDYRATIAPDLSVAAGPDEVRVTGTLDVDDGLFAVEDVPRTAIRPAPETVVHGRAGPERRDTGVPLVIDVDAVLGNVRFVGMGIDAELAGRLEVESSPLGSFRVRGTTGVEQGRFRAYGQELTIERGLLIFSGVPENPALDIRATRQVDDARVGLLIMGTASNPRSEIFSEPAMSESEALSRLLTGRSLAAAGTQDADALERAAIGLGLRRVLPAMDRLGANLGLDELGVDSTGSENGGGSLVAGRRIGEAVYVRYRVGLFDDFSALELIYRVSERFRLRTETGTAQAIDLIYEVNRGEPAAPGDPVDLGAGEGRRIEDVAAPQGR